MKKLIFPAVAALAMGFASCSSDEVNPGNGGGTVNYAEGGYVRLSINMPSVKGVRAANDNFNDGLASEYAVKNAQLILFEEDASNTGEVNAKFHSAYEIDANMHNADPKVDQITSMTKIVKKVNDDATGTTGTKTQKLYALVVLNNNGITSVSKNKLSVNGHNFEGTFKEFLALASSTTTAVPSFAKNVNADGILMLNAPLADKQGGEVEPASVTIHTLTDVSKCIYPTENEAMNKPAADIFVERAVAKVTLSKESSANGGSGELTGPEFQAAGKKVAWDIKGWDLDITNKKSYLVRNVNFTDEPWRFCSNSPSVAAEKYRFIGKEAIKSTVIGSATPTTENFYRTYWAQDPNYSGATPDYVTYGLSRQFFDLVGYAKLAEKFGDSSPRYCFENTFNVDHMNGGEMTRAVVAVQLQLVNADGSRQPVANLYTFKKEKTALYSQADRDNRVKAVILNRIEADILANYKPVAPTDAVGADDITLEYETDIANLGTMKVKKFVVTKSNSGGSTYTYDSDKHSNELVAVNKEVGEISEYKGGIAYYPIVIKHFGDELTPHKNGELPAPEAGITYPAANKAGNYLGRYGVLRNNWYNISVNSISNVGSATVPEVFGKYPETTDPDTPVDEIYNYISVRINVLSWAKRSQSENL